jgi:SAM-dependent methyltransferase
MYKRLNRFEVVASKLKNETGTLVDVGARNRILKKYLPESIRYNSADFDPGHDFRWDLEQPIDQPDDSFDYVVSLDVLEHVEGIHKALKELIRISRRKVFISLPNMAFLGFRLTYFFQGRLSDKYSLLEKHQGDRHRWLTVYPEMARFVESITGECGCSVSAIDLLEGYTTRDKLISRLPIPAALRTYLVVYEITKPA